MFRHGGGDVQADYFLLKSLFSKIRLNAKFQVAILKNGNHDPLSKSVLFEVGPAPKLLLLLWKGFDDVTMDEHI